MDHTEARARLLDTAEELFYERGVQAVGMDELRSAAGVSLKRLYQCFSSKQHLVEAYLGRRDERWRAALAEHVAQYAGTPEERLLAMFDWLHTWFTQPDFRGCAFINSFGELGATSIGVAQAARRHKEALQGYITELTRDLPAPDPVALARQLFLLLDGAITTAAITHNAYAATEARSAAKTLITAAANQQQWTVQQIAELYGMPRTTLYNHLKTGSSPAVPSPSSADDTRQDLPGSEPADHQVPPVEQQTALSGNTSPGRGTSSSTRRAMTSGSRERKRYTGAELDAYQFETVRSDTGQIMSYRVIVAGDVLGHLERAPYGHHGWIARDTHWMTQPHRSGTGRYAKNREQAVIDLFLGLGYSGEQ